MTGVQTCALPISTTKYKVVVKKGRRFAIADAPSGIKAWRIMGMA